MKTTYSVVFAAIVLNLTTWSATNGKGLAFSQGDNTASKSTEEIARLLAKQGDIVVLPAPKGKVKLKIDQHMRRFLLPSGRSAAVLFKLADYTSPYTLKVSSICDCTGFEKSIFLPSGVFLDAEFKQTHKFEEDELRTHQPGFAKGFNVEAAFQLSDERRADCYLLIYTRADLVGKLADKVNISSGGILFGLGYPVSRSFFGTLELQTAPEKKK